MILLLLDVELALVVFVATFPLLALGSVAFRYFSAGAYRAVREKIANVTAYLQETLSGVRIVRAFGQEPRHVERFAELNEEHRAANYRTVQLNATYFPGVELLSSIGTAVILLYGGYQAIDGQITIGVLVAFVGYLQSFFDPIQQLSNLYVTYQQGMAAIDKIFDLLDTEPDMQDSPGARELATIRGDVEFDGVWFCYGGPGRGRAGLGAARRVAARAAPGETLALVGETGAGKSTLAKLVARFYDPQRGAVRVDGTTCATSRRRACAASSGSFRRRGSCSPAPCARTSSSGGRGRASWSWSARPRRSARTSSSRRCPRATTPRSASAAAGCRRASASSSRWRGR